MTSADTPVSARRRAGRRYGALLLLSALAVRLVYLFQSRDGPAFGEPLVDALAHHALAKGIAAGQGLAPLFNGNRPFFEPLFLSAVYAVTGPSVLAAQLLQALVGAGTCVLTASLARRLAGERVALVAGGIVALYGPLVFWDLELVAAGWAAFWTVALLGLLLQVRDAPMPRWGLLLGAAAALSVMTRPGFVPLLALCAVWLAREHARSAGSVAEWARRAAAPLLGFVLLAAPVAWGSWQVSGQARLMPAIGGVNLWIGNNPDRCRTLTLRPGEDFQQLGEEASAAGFVGLAARSEYFRGRVVDYVRAQPLDFLAGLAHKAGQYANGREVPRNLDIYVFRDWSSLLAAAVWKRGHFGFPWGIVFPLALVGLWILRRRLPPPVWIFLVVQPALLVLVFVAGRHRVPLAPLWSLLAAAAVVHGVDAWRAGRRRAVAAGAAAVAALVVLTSLPGPSCEEQLDYRSETYALLARGAYNDGDLERAEALLDQALASDPDSRDAHYRMGRVRLLQDDPAGARVHFDAALAQGPERRALTQRCLAHLQLGELADARRDCEAALALRADERLAELYLGDVEYAEGDRAAARARWRRLSAGRDLVARMARRRLAAAR